jgi:nitronate monooxygenase
LDQTRYFFVASLANKPGLLSAKEETMLHTYLTTDWDLRYPIIGAPMYGVGGGRLARAVTQAGGLGMIGVGSKSPADFILHEASVARGADNQRFGIGLMAWAIERRPELFQAALEAHPFLISISFGSLTPYVEKLHQQGVYLASQVNTLADAIEAEQAGVDLIVAQGTEAGGHTGYVGTLPLLQLLLESVHVPVVAAGGIATSRGVAAALAAGAQGVWVGTRLLVSSESETSEQARARILQAQETETILTRAFDVAQGLPWPSRYPGRALRNHFSDQWHEHTDVLSQDTMAQQQLTEAIKSKDFDLAFIYAGQAVGLVKQQEAALDIIRQLGDGAEQLLSERYRTLFSV